MDFESTKPLYRPSYAKVNLDALAHNLTVIEKRLTGKARVMAVVKADAYGHGAVQISKKLESLGVKDFGVATVEEGVELRLAGIKSKIIVLGGLMGLGEPASKKMVEMDLTPVIHSSAVLESLDADARAAGKRIAAHLKVDTGMSRLGIMPKVLPSVLEQIKECKNLFIEGVMTHLSDAGNIETSSRQNDIFLECKKTIEDALGKIKIWHIASSSAILLGEPFEIKGADECFVRPGLSLYGDVEDRSISVEELKPVMSLMSQVALIKRLPAGVKVSYGGTFTTMRPTKIAVVPVGYADGYPWTVSDKASVLICGQRVPVIGRVTMDMIILDVTDVDDAKVGDEVVLLGIQGNEKISLRELSAWANTITYEILCGISKRMPRVYC